MRTNLSRKFDGAAGFSGRTVANAGLQIFLPLIFWTGLWIGTYHLNTFTTPFFKNIIPMYMILKPYCACWENIVETQFAEIVKSMVTTLLLLIQIVCSLNSVITLLWLSLQKFTISQ